MLIPYLPTLIIPYLLQYTFLLLLVFLVEAVAGVLAYVYEEQVMAELSHTLTTTFNGNYMYEPEMTEAIDHMQTEVWPTIHICTVVNKSSPHPKVKQYQSQVR